MRRGGILVVVAAVVLLGIGAVIVLNHVAYALWAKRVIATYEALKASNGAAVSFAESPQQMRVSPAGDVALLFRPPITTWPWFSHRHAFSDNDYVIVIRRAHEGKQPVVNIEHGLE